MSTVGSLPLTSCRVAPRWPIADEELLRRYLNIYWLRPENAFWTVLRSLAWRQVAMPSPSIDLSCGDGVFSFVHAGGAFGPSFDVFQSERRSRR